MAVPVLIDGRWRPANYERTFFAENPATGSSLSEEYPISSWEDCETALRSAEAAFQKLRTLGASEIAQFLDRFAQLIEDHSNELAAIAATETALPSSPRLKDVELPRTTSQLRLAAEAAREGSWALPTIDTKSNIRSAFGPIGPVCVFGPNNFPFAFNSAAGGDFAAAIAAGNPVIAKANTSHPGTTRSLTDLAQQAAHLTGMPHGIVQMIYRTSHEDGLKLVADSRMGAIAYTGSQSAGLAIKAAADSAGKPIYLELSSINPVVILPGALKDRSRQIAEEFVASCLLGAGQFCTNPGLVFMIDGPHTEDFVHDVGNRFKLAPAGTLLSSRVATSLRKSIVALQKSGAAVITGATFEGANKNSCSNTLLCVTADKFIEDPVGFQREAFGNESLLVLASSDDQLLAALAMLEGNLTGCVYSAVNGEDDCLYDQLAPTLRQKVGRLLNDKMPTGVTVSPAMNHGGPYPATGHPGFTAVGVPASIRRFAMLQCYDNVRERRLPPLLKDKNPTGSTWRSIDGVWTTADVVRQPK